jgi:hypothetical protein
MCHHTPVPRFGTGQGNRDAQARLCATLKQFRDTNAYCNTFGRLWGVREPRRTPGPCIVMSYTRERLEPLYLTQRLLKRALLGPIVSLCIDLPDRCLNDAHVCGGPGDIWSV